MTKITSEQLKVLENNNMIKPRSVTQASEKRRDFYQNSKLIKAHLDPFVTADITKVNKKWSAAQKISGILFLVSIAIIIIGFIIWGETRIGWLLPLPLTGLGTAVICVITIVVSVNKIRRELFFSGITYTVSRSELTDIADQCFSGLTLDQRLIIIKKMISCGKLTERELIGEIAIADTKEKYTVLRAEKELKLIELEREKTKTKIIVNVPALNTNCDNCGAAIKEGVKFCTHCGKKV